MIEIKNLSKQYKLENGNVEALKNVSISISDGDIYGIIGTSGAGKSTLVRCINMLEKPTSGTIKIDENQIETYQEKELRTIRKKIAMIFQGFNLLMQRNCLKNVCFPFELEGLNKKEAENKAKNLLEIVGLEDKIESYPSQLSGGQKQRVAIARALATNPKILICDEATSALDPNTANSILELIKDINKKLGITVVIITHQMDIVKKICNKVAVLNKGEILESGDVKEIFESPKTQITKNLIFSQKSIEN